jgi:hypothetical protein
MSEALALPLWLRLRRLVQERDGLLRACPEELSLLRYYANSIAHLL